MAQLTFEDALDTIGEFDRYQKYATLVAALCAALAAGQVLLEIITMRAPVAACTTAGWEANNLNCTRINIDHAYCHMDQKHWVLTDTTKNPAARWHLVCGDLYRVGI